MCSTTSRFSHGTTDKPQVLLLMYWALSRLIHSSDYSVAFVVLKSSYMYIFFSFPESMISICSVWNYLLPHLHKWIQSNNKTWRDSGKTRTSNQPYTVANMITPKTMGTTTLILGIFCYQLSDWLRKTPGCNIPFPAVLPILNTGEMAGRRQSIWLSLLLGKWSSSSLSTLC